MYDVYYKLLSDKNSKQEIGHPDVEIVDPKGWVDVVERAIAQAYREGYKEAYQRGYADGYKTCADTMEEL